MGSVVPATASASAALPQGTFAWGWVEVKLPASAWLQAAKAAAAKNPKENAETAKSGWVLPGTAGVTIRYNAPAGSIEVARAELLEPGPSSPNLLGNGGFEALDNKGYLTGWSQAVKYRYFPPRH